MHGHYVGTPAFTDPYGVYSYGYLFTISPTISPAPSLSLAPTNSWTAQPSMTPAPTVTFAPTRSPYEYLPTADTTPYCQLHDVSVCWGNSRRFLQVAENRPFDSVDRPGGLESSNPAFGDLDGDDDLDLVVGDRNGELYFFRNVGSVLPEFVVPKTGRANPFNGIAVGERAAPVLADLDNDGDLDLIVGGNKRLSYYNNTGSARPPMFDRTGDTSLFSGAIGDDELDYVPTLVDLDDDGDLDIIVGHKARISYLENIGSAAAPQFVWRTGDADPFDGMAFGDEMNPALTDLDGDGDFDLAVGDKAGLIKYYENVGSAEQPQFVARAGDANPFEGVAVEKGYCAPRFVDIDADGDVDLVTGDSKDGLTLYENKASAAVAPEFVEIASTASPLGFVDVDVYGTAAAYSAPTLLDYDGDNDLDVVVGHSMFVNLDGNPDDYSMEERRTIVGTDTLFVYENVGSAKAPEFVHRTGSGQFALVDAFGMSAATFGDLDQDGDVDLVLGDQMGYIFYYENMATVSGFVARQGRANPVPPHISNNGVQYFNPALCDLDGDSASPRCLSRDLDRAAATKVAPSQATSTSSLAIPLDCTTSRTLGQGIFRTLSITVRHRGDFLECLLTSLALPPSSISTAMPIGT